MMTSQFQAARPCGQPVPGRVALAACVLGVALGGVVPAGAAKAQEALPRAARQGPLYITPNVEGLLQCDEALQVGQIAHAAEAFRYCMDKGLDGSAALKRLLDTLEPGGPSGDVQVGYTLTVQLLELFRQAPDGQWKIDDKRVDAIMRLLEKTERPAVLYLSSSHFDSLGPLPEALARDPANLMKMADGQPPRLGYFGYPIAPYTLRPDADIPVNRYRFAALRHMAERVKALAPRVQQRIVAITLAGEVHHLFPDFENGTGNFGNVQVTDYDPASIAAFRQWLRRQYGSIERFNQAHGFDYASFEAVNAPSKDIRRERLSRYGEHYDAYAAGRLPVAGWLWDPEGKLDGLDLYVNGRHAGPIERGFNRLDVYRARDDVTTPNVGFRHDLDFSQWAPGRYRLQVVARSQDRQYLLAERVLLLVPRDQGKVPGDVPSGLAQTGPGAKGWQRFLPRRLHDWLARRGWLHPAAISGLPGALSGSVHFWVDMPGDALDVYYNPLARDWDTFRAWQVAQFMATFHRQAVEAGLPADKLYSHQVVPQANSSWNAQLFATEQTLRGPQFWKPGFNLYGGSTQGPWLARFLHDGSVTDYGVPEFNPQQWKRADVHLSAMRAHYEAGARFISPYYFSLIADSYRGSAEHGVNRMELRLDNPKEGSAAFYEAIRQFARQ